LDGLVERIAWHRGRSPAYGEGISFWALGEMIRGRAGLAETDDERTTRTKIAEMLEGLELEETERRWIEPALLALLGIETGIGAEQLFGAWRTFFERLAATRTVVLVFEDLHWADAGTLDFIDHLLEWSRSIPLYIVTLARPELMDKRSDWGAGRRNFTSLYLEPLTEAAMRALLAGLVPGLPEVAVSAVVARAEGIPLYAVETVRMLVAEGRLEAAGDGTYTPTGDLSTLAIPETLTALIAARLDALDPADRSLVLDAAVLGLSFTLPGLAVVSGIAAAELEPRLRALARRELFNQVTDPRSPERGQYAFVQALIREVAYNTLAKKDRKTRHLAAARFFESLGTDELAAGLAGHYLAARENATEGPEADALAAQARVALKGAAERAAALGAHEQAMSFYEQAMTVTTDPADLAELLERAGESASAAGRHDTAERHLLAAIDARRVGGERSTVARSLTALGRALNLGSRSAEVVSLLEPAATEFADIRDDPNVISMMGQLARGHFLLDHNERAIEVADGVLARAEHADLGIIVADTLITKGTALGSLGRTIEGLGVLRAGKELAEQLDLGETMLRGYINLSSVLASRNPREALEICREGLRRARQLGRRSPAAVMLANAYESALRIGDWTWAETELDTSLADQLDPEDRLWLLGGKVSIGALRGSADDTILDEMRRLVGSSTEPSLQTALALATGLAALGAGRLGDAREAWHRVTSLSASNLPDAMARASRAALWLGDSAGVAADLAVIDASGMHGAAIDADRVTLRAGLAALDGRSAEALTTYRDAIRAWRDLDLAWDEALTGIDMATLLDPSQPEVQAAAAASREILVRLGAAPFIERLDAAMGRGSATGRPSTESSQPHAAAPATASHLV
ncbi:MAG: hypothetical protein ABI555_10415, partial [Chloroflexota bacterium]